MIHEIDPETTRKSLRVLDCACGKGGVLGKWTKHSRGIQTYIGCDVARGSLVQAAKRARSLRKRLPECTFVCVDLGTNVEQKEHLSWSLQEDRYGHDEPEFKRVRGDALNTKFDVVSIQFAIHYMMQTKQKAQRFFQTVSERLPIGGSLIATTIDARVVFERLLDHMRVTGLEPNHSVALSVGSGACQLRFEPEMVRRILFGPKQDSGFGLEYRFQLIEDVLNTGVGNAVDNLTEWLAPIPVLKELGQEVGLELEYVANFQELFCDKTKQPSDTDTPKEIANRKAARRRLYDMRVLNRNGTISADESDILRLYVALRFNKCKSLQHRLIQ